MVSARRLGARRGLCDISILADAGLRQWHGRDEDLVPSGLRDRDGGVGRRVEKGHRWDHTAGSAPLAPTRASRNGASGLWYTRV